MGAVCCAGHAMLGVEVGFRTEMELGLGSGTTFITAHLFFYSTYNICQKQDTHTHMNKHTHTWAHGHTLTHTLAHMGIYWLFILYSNARHRTPNVSEALAVSLAGRLAEGYPGRGFVPCPVCECLCVCTFCKYWAFTWREQRDGH